MLDELLDRLRESGDADKIAAELYITVLREEVGLLTELIDRLLKRFAAEKTIDPPRDSA